MDYLLFDLDGTLLNSGEGITRGVEAALHTFGIEVPDRAALRCYIGPPLLDSFQRFAHLDAAQAVEARRQYKAYYDVTGLYENEPYPGVAELLEQLQQEGKHLFVATSKPEALSRKILTHFGLAAFFEDICGASEDGKRSEKADVIAHLLSTHPEIDRTRTVMVGDRLHDIEGAHRNGLPCIAVLYGFGDLEEFRRHQADFIAADARELGTLLRQEPTD